MGRYFTLFFVLSSIAVGAFGGMLVAQVLRARITSYPPLPILEFVPVWLWASTGASIMSQIFFLLYVLVKWRRPERKSFDEEATQFIKTLEGAHEEGNR